MNENIENIFGFKAGDKLYIADKKQEKCTISLRIALRFMWIIFLYMDIFMDCMANLGHKKNIALNI